MVETLLEVRNLSKTFRYRTGWFRPQTVEAVKSLSFTLREKQTLALSARTAPANRPWRKCWPAWLNPPPVSY
jgi:cationic peptide transport system ATP-binding protein